MDVVTPLKRTQYISKGIREPPSSRTSLTDHNRNGGPIFPGKWSAISQEIPRGMWMGAREFPGNSTGHFPAGHPNFTGNFPAIISRGISREMVFRGNGIAGKYPGGSPEHDIRRIPREMRTRQPRPHGNSSGNFPAGKPNSPGNLADRSNFLDGVPAG